MDKAKINILNLQKVNFSNRATGEVNTMTKITYGMEISKSDRFVGLSILECYCNEKAFVNLEKFINKEVVATLEKRPTSNGVKYVITQINNESIK